MAEWLLHATWIPAVLGTLGMLYGCVALGRAISRAHDEYWSDRHRDRCARLLANFCEQDRIAADRDGVEYDPIASRRKWAAWLGLEKP